ncbi:MAG: recombinase family protein [Ardenticatenaceae bacterium]|nr:recombinase family protein [Ardenticatenaceae bacterium]
MSKVSSGHYRQCLPTGLVWLDDETVVKDPDEQVQHVLELVFAKFAELGSCHGVFRCWRREQILLPRRATGAGQRAVVWKQAAPTAVQAILTNPADAGAFVSGRQQHDPTRRTAAHHATPRVNRPRDEWVCSIAGGIRSRLICPLGSEPPPAANGWRRASKKPTRIPPNSRFRLS